MIKSIKVEAKSLNLSKFASSNVQDSIVSSVNLSSCCLDSSSSRIGLVLAPMVVLPFQEYALIHHHVVLTFQHVFVAPDLFVLEYLVAALAGNSMNAVLAMEHHV
ncbi:hypothetical protein Acr_00g0070340 [Actinidia rufa]|uniref:Uncharacterized protein n=1 Tax=Actinidia rufa TaxID=165716 RepID=A0A7J0DRD4_9ERIC|nr:hypothetical protein Acr_00g0070340 [Actinidia rufa]